MRKERVLTGIVREWCVEHGINLVVGADDWVLTMARDDVRKVIYGYRMGLNGESVAALCDDKAAMSERLALASIPAVRHVYLPGPAVQPFVAQTATDVTTALQTALQSGACVVKPNNGTGGRFVQRVTDMSGARRAVSDIHASGACACVSSYYDVKEEVRCIFFREELLLHYRKARDTDWRHNLSCGARAVVLQEEDAFVTQGRRTMRELGLTVGCVDLIRTGDEILVLEVNAGLMMERFARQGPDYYAQARQVYGRCLEEIWGISCLNS